MRYYTKKNQVHLKKGQALGYKRGHGYYAKALRKSTVGVPKEQLKHPTSRAPKRALHPRTAMANFLHWALLNEPRIHYAEVRPITRVKKGARPRLPWTTDCSGSGTTACQSAGIPDPNGRGYDGAGYTGTIMSHCKRIGIRQLKVGDPVVFGCKSYPTGHHVCWVLAIHSRTPEGIVTFSHGQEKGPFAITVAEEAKYQPDGIAGVRYYSLGV